MEGELVMSVEQYSRRKFLPPILPERFCPRNDLMVIFDRVRSGHYLFVSAPAGYGKSVSTRIWLSRTKRRIIWVKLDQYDDHLPLFYAELCSGLASAQPDNVAMREILENSAFKANPIELAIKLFSAFQDDGQEYVLVLDDFHEITDQKILQSLPHVNQRLPDSFVVALLSRKEPESAIMNEIMHMGSVHIKVPDLSFSLDEIRQYLTMTGIEFSESEVQEIYQATDGWAMGVFTLSDITASDRRKRGIQIIESYFRNQIWETCNEATREFILNLAVSDEMPGDLCRLLTENDNAVQILEDLYRKHFYLSKTADGVYYCHQLVLKVIRDMPEFKALNLADKYKVMAVYYGQQNSLFKASNFAIMSGDMQTIIDLGFPSIHQSVYAFEEQKNFASDLDLSYLPEDKCAQYPLLYWQKAWLSYLEASADGLTYYFDKMYQSAPVVLRDFPDFAYMYHRLLVLDHRKSNNEICQWSARHLALKTAQKNDRLGIISYTMQMPFTHRCTRDFHDLGDLKSLETWQNLMSAGADYINESFYPALRSGLLLEKDQGKEALDAALTAVSLLNASTNHEIVFSTYMHLAAVYDALGYKTKLADIVQVIESFISNGFMFLQPNFLAFKARRLIYRGNKSAAVGWLNNYFVHNSHKLKIYEIYQYFTTIRAYILLEKVEEAHVLIGLLKKLVNNFNRFLDMAETGVLEAILMWISGQKSEAIDTLDSVLRQLQPGCFIRIISNEGTAVLPILKRIMTKNKNRDFGIPIDNSYLNNVYLSTYAKSKICEGITADHKTNIKKLSKKQTYVLTLLAQGMNSSEIVKASGLTINTIKTHTREIYARLEVNSAADAIIKARDLGFI